MVRVSDNPFVKLVAPAQSPDGRTTVVLLDRIQPGTTPDYCVHGKVTCYGGCGEWLWLGDNTYRAVSSGRAAPLCFECAPRFVPKGARPTTNLRDHRRADGPH